MCNAKEVSNKDKYGTFARTFPTFKQYAKSVLTLLQHFNWHVVSIVAGSEPKCQTARLSLEEFLPLNGVEVKHSMEFISPYFGSPYEVMKDDSLLDIIEASYRTTRSKSKCETVLHNPH